MSQATFHVSFREDGTAVVKARMVADDGSGTVQEDGQFLLQQADYESIGLTVRDLSDPEAEEYEDDLDPTEVVYDTLQDGWDVDDTGYNLKVTIPAEAFPTGGHTYLVLLEFETTGGTAGWAQWKGPALAREG